MITVRRVGVSDVDVPIVCGAGGRPGASDAIMPTAAHRRVRRDRPAPPPEVRPAGLEPATKDLEGPRSVQLSYGRSDQDCRATALQTRPSRVDARRVSHGPAVVDAAPHVGVPAPRLDVPGLLADVHRLPGARPTLLRVVQLADSPDCSVRSLAEAAAVDPAFTARLLQLANSAYYGRPGRVTAIGPAVGVLGTETLRGLAVTMALGLSGEHGPMPAGFADRAAATAAGSRLVAPMTGADPGDAFCVGLLREVGQALLFRAAPQSYPALLASCDEAGLADAERTWCGTTSGEVAAQALAGAGLPDSVCRTIAEAQVDDEQRRLPATPLGRALRGGVVLARAVATGEVGDATTAELVALTDGELDQRGAGVLVLRAASQAAGLSAALD